MNQSNSFTYLTGQPISSIDISRDFLAIGQLDEKVLIYKAPFTTNNKLYNYFDGLLMGVIDVKIDENETKIAASCFDNMIRVWDLEDKKSWEIKCDVFENWKIQFIDNYNIVTSGEFGKVGIYHIETNLRLATAEPENNFYSTALSINHKQQLISIGNEAGYVFLVSWNNASNTYSLKYVNKLKPHGKSIKAIQFLAENKLLTASDDGMIKLYDLNKNEIIRTFTGHKFGITGLDLHPFNENNFVSCAQDRQIKWWDINQRYSVKSFHSGNDKPEGINSVKYTKDAKFVCAAHECGFVTFYN